MASSEPTEKIDQAASPWPEKGGREVAPGRRLADFSECRIRRDEARNGADLELGRHGKTPYLDQFAGVRADYGRAENMTVRICDDLDKSNMIALCDCSIVVVESGSKDADATAMLIARLQLGKAYLGKLRIGVSNPRQCMKIDFSR